MKTNLKKHDDTKDRFSRDSYKLKRFIKAIKAVLLWPLICRNWVLGFCSYLKSDLQDKSVEYHMNNGLKLMSDGGAQDLQVIREVYLHKTYMLDTIDLSKVKTIVDFGAHKGYVSLELARITNGFARIFCFEPEQKNFQFLKENIKRNNFQDVIIADNSAIYTSYGKKAFYISGSNYAHSLDPYYQNDSVRIEVLCKDIPSLMKEYGLEKIDLMKIDIEGAEYEVLMSLEKGIIDNMEYILIEAHNTDTYNNEDMIRFLRENSFECLIPYEFETTIIAFKR